MSKGIIFFNIILLFFFFIGLLFLSISYILSIIIILLSCFGQLFITIFLKISHKKPLWNEKILKKNIIAHCDGTIKSIIKIDKWLNFHEPHYAIEIINCIPHYPNRISPIEGSITISNHCHFKNKNHSQIEAIIKNNNIQIGLGDISIEKSKGFIDILPNKYLLNDFIEQYCFKDYVNTGDNLWSVYFYSTSYIYIPVDKINLQVVENQTLVQGETIIGNILINNKNKE